MMEKEILTAGTSQNKTIMKIYISGKITGKDPQPAAEAFFNTAEKLKAAGYDVVNPMELPHNHDKNWSSYMKECIKYFLDCDAICMIDDWEKSEGATIELDLARKLDMKIYYHHSGQIQEKRELPTEEKVLNRVCEIAGKSVSDVLDHNKKRNREFVIIRQVCMTLLILRYNFSVKKAGQFFLKDHSTVIHGIKTVEGLLKTNAEFKEDYGHLFYGIKFPTYK